MTAVSADLLLAGAIPGGKAGNSVSADVLAHALRCIGSVTILSHRVAPPTWKESIVDGVKLIRVGVQPLLIHGEAIPAGWIHRKRLRRWPFGWVVNSRYASALYAAGVPYVIWEATTARDELGVSSFADVRRSARGTGAGFALHRGLLPIGEALEGRLYRHAAAVYTMSDHTRSRILATHHLAPDTVKVLLHPPSPSFTRTLEHTRQRPAKRAPSSGQWRLLFVGRADDARKNFELLPGVMRRLNDAGRRATLTVIGPHNELWRSRLSLEGLGDSIDFAGSVSLEALVEAYRQHDLLLVPSRQEGFGIVVAEAFAAGLPVVSTRCGGPETIIAESGAGELVGIDADQMATAIIRVLEDRGRMAMMREKAMMFANGPLSFNRFASRVEEITREMIVRRN